nr:hypothetical protein [Tanacetum cinerariifolium]
MVKQYQNEVNELRAKRLARNANPLALVATAQADRDQYYQTSRDKGKEIAKPITPLSETASEEDIDPEQAQRDKDMQKNLALITKTVNVAAAREKVRSSVVQKSGIQCFNYTDEEVDKQELEAHYSYMAKIQEVPTSLLDTDSEPVEQVQNDAGYNVFANHLQHSEQSESVSNTYLVETDDSNVIPNSPDMCEDDIQNEQNDVESNDERVALANLKLDVDENKKIQKQLNKANTTLAQELKECKAILAKTSKSLGKSISVRDSCLVALQTMQAEFEKYKAFNDHTIDYQKLKRKLNEALGQLAQKDTVIREGLKTKAYEILVVKQKHGELMKQSLLTKSHYEGLVKQKTKAQSKVSYLYAFPYDQSTHANKLIPDGEETLALERESRPKLNKDLVRPYDYTTLNSIYEIFKPPAQEYEIQLAHANEIRRKMWRKSFVKSKPNIYKNQEMHADLKYVESLKKEIDELKSDKAGFSDMYDEILQDFVSKDVICSYLQSLSDLDVLAELQCVYLHKVKECDCLAQKLLKQTKSVSKEVHNELLKRFAKVENI